MMNTRHLAVFTFLCACSASPEEEAVDGVDDSFTTDGKTDTGGVVDGTPEARAVLRIANTASLETLDHEVPLDSRAAANIVAARPIETLAELDAVAYVGPVAFGNLLEHVHTKTWRDWLAADFAIEVVVPVPMTKTTWWSQAQGGPYNPKTTVMGEYNVRLRLRDDGAAVRIGTLEGSTLVAEDGTFVITDSYSGLTGTDDRFYHWGSLRISGAIDSLGDVIVAEYSEFDGRGNAIYGYNGTRETSTGEGRAPLP